MIPSEIYEISPVLLTKQDGKIYQYDRWARIGCQTVPYSMVEVENIPYVDVGKLKDWVKENPKHPFTEYVEETISILE
jgi:hypothetical protein